MKMHDLWEVPDDAIVPAVWFYDHGVGVFPLKSRSKEPACSSWDDFACTREQASRFANYGVRLNATLGVLDTDERDDEYWVLQQIADRVLCDTPFVVTTARGMHRYYRLAGPLPKFIHRDGLSIEFRNVGQYVVGPGSVHPSGVTYTASNWSWRWQDVPFFPAEFCFDDRPLAERGSGSGDPLKLPEAVHQNERHETLHKVMRSLAARGVPLEGALEACRLENALKCRPPLKDDDALTNYLTRAYKQKDRANFTRTPQTGWVLAANLVDVGLSIEATLIAVRSIDPTFDPEVAE